MRPKHARRTWQRFTVCVGVDCHSPGPTAAGGRYAASALGTGPLDGHGAASPAIALDADEPSVTLEDLRGAAQPQADPLAHRAGRGKRVENVGPFGLGDLFAGVIDSHTSPSITRRPCWLYRGAWPFRQSARDHLFLPAAARWYPSHLIPSLPGIAQGHAVVVGSHNFPPALQRRRGGPDWPNIHRHDGHEDLGAGHQGTCAFKEQPPG